ncbi:hypothetical protein C2857_002996 [Epichloe festucae Fl1]|uniref:LYR motif-containing protein Cup1-like N-terminal domain-containing protein n=1 Tax=Epichloe festucae (strain Fl1) TaxID=877507 RepID=A0A7S9PWT9_EPIFF|nr:hypothetical protein C2857_002996 [Epichloe festucae Fl1]
MPAPWQPLPQSLRPLQLYRCLLREASYLPPAFRRAIDSTIRTRFHKNRENGMHTNKRLSKAMSSLRTLRAANSGDKAAMTGLVMKGFGRTGNRRRQLMAQLVKPQGPGDTQALESILDQTAATSTASRPHETRSPKNSFFERWDQPKLLQIIRSQKQQQKDTKGSTSWPGQSVKTVDPDLHVPETNIWGKPPAPNFVRTKRAHWWRRNADKIMPPLGKGEWDLLQRLSNGAQETGEWAVPSRRPQPRTDSSTNQLGMTDQWNWEAHATASIARVEQPKTMLRQRRTGQHDSGPYGGRLRSREVSGRWFRRVYNRTWQLTPTMEQDPNTLRYTLKWGHAAPNLPSATASQMQVFEGVDEKGNKAH